MINRDKRNGEKCAYSVGKVSKSLTLSYACQNIYLLVQRSDTTACVCMKIISMTMLYWYNDIYFK